MALKYGGDIVLAHRIETTINQDGTVMLDNLPFHAGETVEIIILPAINKNAPENTYLLRGTSIQYDRPTEPVGDAWDAAQ
jgi:hypothetical protein